MNYVYSASNNAFYPVDLQLNYEDSGSWPLDAILVNDDIYNEFSASQPPDGMVRIAGTDGLPAWVEIPPPTKEELITIANVEKSTRLASANEKIAPLADAVEFDMATDEEVEELKEWKKYRILLTRIDISTAPDIGWPTQPKVLL